MEEQNEKRIGTQEEQESIWSDAGQSEDVWRGQSAAPSPLSRPMGAPEAQPEPKRASEAQPEPKRAPEAQPEPEPRRAAEAQPDPESNGRPIHPSAVPYRPDQSEPLSARRQNDMAVAALVMGILSLVGSCCAWGGVAFGALGILFALLSRADEPMEGKAKTGMLLSIIGIALGFFAVLALLMFEIAA